VLLTEFLDNQHSTRRVIWVWLDINFAAGAQSLAQILLSRREPLNRRNLTVTVFVFFFVLASVLPLLLLSFMRLLLSVGLLLLIRSVNIGIGIGVSVTLISGFFLFVLLRLLLWLWVRADTTESPPWERICLAVSREPDWVFTIPVRVGVCVSER
jgi:hypothetical protein